MPTLNDLLARRATTWEEYQETSRQAETGGFSDELRQKLDRLDESIRTDTGDIERLQRTADLDKRFDAIDRHDPPDPPAPGGGAGEPDQGARYAEAFRAWCAGGSESLEPEQRALLRQGQVSGAELRAPGVTTGAAGGFLVPEGWRAKLVETMKWYGGMRQVAATVTTESGNPLPWATNDDTGNEGVYLGENVQATELDLTFGEDALGAHTLNSRVVRVSLQLLQDAAVDEPIDNLVPRKLGERIGRRENRAFTVGTGTGEPEGSTVGATAGVTGAVGSTVTLGPTQTAALDNLIDLEHSIDPAYRNERARWMFHDLTLAHLRKYKDADGRFLWQPSVQGGAPSTFNGRPYTINNNMPVLGAGARSILFGDFTAGYIIRDVRAITVLRLVERYADFLQVGFLAFTRHDGRVDDANAIRAFQHSAT